MGTYDVMNVAMRGNFIVTLCAGAGCLCISVPALTAFLVLFLRWSPLMLAYHVFGCKYKLMELEMQRSLPYWSLIAFDWSIFTGSAMVLLCGILIPGDAMLRIALILKAIR